MIIFLLPGGLISCAVTAQLICNFVFAYADCCFCGAAAHLCFHFFLYLQSYCDSDEIKIGHRVFSLDYRPISGDVTDKRNSFSTPSFKPQGRHFVRS